jgi:hypothetical protein
MSEFPIWIYRCPTCGDVTVPRGTPALYCIGNANGPQRWTDENVGDHPCEEMDAIRVFAEDDVRPLWRLTHEIGEKLSGTIGMAAASEADDFPAPEEWC